MLAGATKLPLMIVAITMIANNNAKIPMFLSCTSAIPEVDCGLWPAGYSVLEPTNKSS